MMSPVNTSMLPSRWDRDWTSCWWTSVLWLGVGSSWNCTFTCLEELLYSSTIWPIVDLAKNLALANVIVVLPPLVAAPVPLLPQAARAGAAAPAASTAPTPFTKLRLLNGEPSRAGEIGILTPMSSGGMRSNAELCASRSVISC